MKKNTNIFGTSVKTKQKVKAEIKRINEKRINEGKQELTEKQRKRITEKIVKQEKRKRNIKAILVSLGILTGGVVLLNPANEPETKPTIETTIDETKTTSDAKEEFTQSMKVKTYNQILEDIANEYNEKYGTKLSPTDITYIKSNPQYLTIDEDGTYVQDYRQSGENNEYIYDNIKDVYVFINKKDDTIISSIGKVENEVKNIDTNIVMLSGKQEYVESDKKIDITKGKDKEQLEEMYKAMQEKSKQKTQDDTQEKQVKNEERE